MHIIINYKKKYLKYKQKYILLKKQIQLGGFNYSGILLNKTFNKSCNQLTNISDTQDVFLIDSLKEPNIKLNITSQSEKIKIKQSKKL